MAADHALRSVINTLTTTVADTITLDQLWPAVEITNLDTTNYVYVLCDGTLTPVALAEANNTTAVPPGATKVIRSYPVPATNTIVISVVGSGGKYAVEGVN